jgi:hypothetical protein
LPLMRNRQQYPAVLGAPLLSSSRASLAQKSAL